MIMESGGPYLAAALFCDKALEEKDGTLSAIRMVNRITHTISGPDAPEAMPPITINLYAILSFKSGAARGKYTLKLIPNAPSRKQMPEFSAPVLLEGDDRGVNIVLNLDIQVEEEGLYWFDVILNEQLITRMPLRIVYQMIKLETASTPP